MVTDFNGNDNGGHSRRGIMMVTDFNGNDNGGHSR